jgi:hypothetical protein
VAGWHQAARGRVGGQLVITRGPRCARSTMSSPLVL